MWVWVCAPASVCLCMCVQGGEHRPLGELRGSVAGQWFLFKLQSHVVNPSE